MDRHQVIISRLDQMAKIFEVRNSGNRDLAYFEAEARCSKVSFILNDVLVPFLNLFAKL